MEDSQSEEWKRESRYREEGHVSYSVSFSNCASIQVVCPEDTSHMVSGWLVITDEADDEGDSRSKVSQMESISSSLDSHHCFLCFCKVVPPGMIARILSAWAVHLREELDAKRATSPAPASGVRGAKSSFAERPANGRSDPSGGDDDVEAKLRARFGDFTPFLDDDEDEVEENGGGFMRIALQPLEGEEDSNIDRNLEGEKKAGLVIFFS